jgi:DNA-binding MarR family transcriptional regulator
MKTKPERVAVDPRLLEGLHECAAFNIRSTARRVTHYFDEALAPTGLRVTQTSILVGLARHQPTTVGELAEILVLDHSTLVRNLKRLEEMKLVVTRHGQDRRTRTVQLSPKGSQKVEEMIPLWRDAQERLIKKLGHENWQQQIESLKGIRDAIEI